MDSMQSYNLEVSKWIAVVAVCFIICGCGPAKESSPKTTQDDVAGKTDSLRYLPVAGDRVIIFTHRFNADDYEEGKRTVVEGFSKAMG